MGLVGQSVLSRSPNIFSTWFPPQPTVGPDRLLPENVIPSRSMRFSEIVFRPAAPPSTSLENKPRIDPADPRQKREREKAIKIRDESKTTKDYLAA